MACIHLVTSLHTSSMLPYWFIFSCIGYCNQTLQGCMIINVLASFLRPIVMLKLFQFKFPSFCQGKCDARISRQKPGVVLAVESYIFLSQTTGFEHGIPIKWLWKELLIFLKHVCLPIKKCLMTLVSCLSLLMMCQQALFPF